MSLSLFLLSLPIWLINGILVCLYWLRGHLPDLLSIVCALSIVWGLDPLVQRRALARPRCHERGLIHTGSPQAQYLTLATLTIWLLVSQLAHFPIPLIGGFLWLVGLVGATLVSEQSLFQLWWAKVSILIYAGLVLLMHYGADTLGAIHPSQWSQLVGSSADAQLVLERTRGSLISMGLLVLFVIYPLGHTALMLNPLLRNPKPLYATFAEAAEVIARLKVRN